MAIRFYLANDAAPYTPATIRGTWSDKALTGASALSRRKVGAGTSVAKAETSNSSSWSVLMRRFVSDTINNAGTLQGAFSLVVGALENNSDANMSIQLHMYVIAGDSDTVRGALTSLALVGSSEFPIVSFGLGASGIQATGTLTPVNVEPGDRIVLELGYRAANTTTSSRTGTMYYGGTASDLSVNDRNVDTRPGWVEFAHAAVHDAFAIPFRSGDTTTVLGVQSVVWDPGKTKSVLTTDAPGPVCTASGYKSMRTVINGVRPPGRPPGHPPAPEEGMFTYGERLQDGGVIEVRPKVSDRQSTAVRVPTTTAESLHEMHPKVVPYAVLQGDHDITPPDIDLLTAPPPPKPPPTVRFIAQDIRTRRWLNWELPLIDVSITWTLSGPTLLRAKLHPESPTLRELGITAWATFIHIDIGGQLLGTVIWQPTKIDGETYDVEGVGFSGYAQGMPYLSDDQYYRVDPCDVMRRIWLHLQSYPDAALGVAVTNAMCGLEMGIPPIQQVDDEGLPKFDNGTEVTPPDPDSTVTQETLKIVRYEQDPDTGDLTVWYNDGAVYLFKPIFDPAQPYVLSWYSDTDCGQEFDNLCRTAKVEYRETTWWETDPEQDIAIVPKARRLIDLTYPRLGRKRYELRCAQDENMLEAIPLEESTGAAGYASQIWARGAGEGREAVRGTAGQADPRRIRRVATVVDGTLNTLTAAQAFAQDELLRRRAANTVGKVVLMDWHPNAPIGSFMVGDELLITGFVPWAGYIEFWHRVISYTWEPEKNIVTVDLRRSEQFAYGKPLPDPPPTPRYPWVDQPDYTYIPVHDDEGDGLTPLPGQLPI